MELIKKNWLIIAIALVLIYLWYSSEQSKSSKENCKKMDDAEWERTLKAYQDNFAFANSYIKTQGYCARTSS